MSINARPGNISTKVRTRLAFLIGAEISFTGRYLHSDTLSQFQPTSFRFYFPMLVLSREARNYIYDSRCFDPTITTNPQQVTKEYLIQVMKQ